MSTVLEMKKVRLAILENEHFEADHCWEEACRERSDLIDWEKIDLTRSDWFDRITGGRFDGLLARPPAYNSSFKTLYDERIRILHTVCGMPVYPSLEEIEIYENKKYFAYWLAANDIPHPSTKVYYYENEALAFLERTTFPVVGKYNIGASGRGVSILKTKEEALHYVNGIFAGKGGNRSVGPVWKKKGFIGRVFKKMLRPGEFKAKLRHYQHQRSDVQKDFVILQAFVPHDYEWRCVRIGASFFAHKKLAKDGKASGTLLKNYDNPPLRLLDFVREVTDKQSFTSQAVDIFETGDGRFLVNEMQCIFGQSDPYQMLVDGTPGRYRWVDGGWRFEAGDFNRHKSYLLRLDHFLSLLNAEQKEPIS